MTDMKTLLDKLLAENSPPPAEPAPAPQVKKSEDNTEEKD
jgi:hypothetical protein